MKKLSLFYEGAIYHVILRNNFKVTLFDSEEDSQYFLGLLASAYKKYACKFHLFSLTTASIHLVVEVSQDSLSQIVQLISNCYTRYRNKKSKERGRIFTEGHQAKLVTNKSYLFELCHYLCELEGGEKRCCASQLADLGKVAWEWLETTLLQKAYSEDFRVCSQPYKFLQFDKTGIVAFNAVNQKKCKRNSISLSSFSLEQVAQIICAEFEVGMDELVQTGEGVTVARLLLAYYCLEYTSVGLKQVSAFLHVESDALLQELACAFAAIELQQEVKSTMKKIEKAILLSVLD